MGMGIPMEVGSDNITGFPMGPLEISCHWKSNGVVEIQSGKGTPMGYGNSNGRSLVGPRQGVVPWVVTLSVTWVSLSWDMGCGPYLIHVIRPSCPLPSSECLGPFHGFDLKCPFVYPSLILMPDCTRSGLLVFQSVPGYSSSVLEGCSAHINGVVGDTTFQYPWHDTS